jgi:hypothetical protein
MTTQTRALNLKRRAPSGTLVPYDIGDRVTVIMTASESDTASGSPAVTVSGLQVTVIWPGSRVTPPAGGPGPGGGNRD